MRAYLLLSSPIDGRAALRRALVLLAEDGVDIRRRSPLLETPARLGIDAGSDIDEPNIGVPRLNLAIEVRSAGVADAQGWRELARRLAARVEPDPGRPRRLDARLLLCDDGVGQPHTEMETEREALRRDPARLVPLLHLRPRLRLAGDGGTTTLLDHARALPFTPPSWFGIINLTPDSFSDGGRHQRWQEVEPLLERMDAAGVQVFDFGAESTRPGAVALDAEDEWRRLGPVLEQALQRYRGDPLRPWFSVDTYHPRTAARAIELGVDIINDVGGLGDPRMREIAADSTRGGPTQWVAMHQLGLPADSAITLPADADPLARLERWLLEAAEAWQRCGIDPERVIADPGIGFGKTAVQSLRLLRGIGALRRHGLRLLVGHSRKSFMRRFSTLDVADKDAVTVGASLALSAAGVDFLRVHNVPVHAAAYRGWSQLQPRF